MDERNPQFAAAMDELFPQPEGEHVATERLIAYHHDELASEEEERVREHLAACSECSSLLLQLVSFDEDADFEDYENSPVDLEEEADWRALSTRLEEEGPRETAATQTATSPLPNPPASRSPLAYALAASLLMTLSLAWWVARLTTALDEARSPQTNIDIVSLEPDGYSRGSTDEAEVSGLGDRFVVILNPPFPESVEHRAEVTATDGQRIWQGGGMMPTESGTFHLELSRHLMPAGNYRIHLFEQDRLVAEFELRVGQP